jgi:DNA polymerase I-like protein with 3'-5' exonuclease and polymerase domains
MKQALIDLEAAGELPILQVYDECGFSVGSHEQGQRNCEIMENALLGEVPALVEPTYGANWGEAK